MHILAVTTYIQFKLHDSYSFAWIGLLVSKFNVMNKFYVTISRFN